MTDDPSTARDEFHVLYDAFGTYRPGHTERVIEVLNNLHAAGWQITRRDPAAGRVLEPPPVTTDPGHVHGWEQNTAGWYCRICGATATLRGSSSTTATEATTG